MSYLTLDVTTEQLNNEFPGWHCVDAVHLHGKVGGLTFFKDSGSCEDIAKRIVIEEDTGKYAIVHAKGVTESVAAGVVCLGATARTRGMVRDHHCGLDRGYILDGECIRRSVTGQECLQQLKRRERFPRTCDSANQEPEPSDFAQTKQQQAMLRAISSTEDSESDDEDEWELIEDVAERRVGEDFVILAGPKEKKAMGLAAKTTS